MTALRRWPRWAEAAAVTVIVLVGALLACHWALQVDNWRVMTDELLYVKMAQGFAEHLSLHPEIRGAPIANYSVLYSLVLAPMLAWLDMGTAFRLAHGLSAVLLASGSIPAYLLTRYVSRSPAVAVAAALPIALMPWLLFSLNLLTEVLAAPLFAWTVYLYVRAVAEPSLLRDALALVVAVLLVVTRTQFIVMPVVLPVIVVLHEVGMQLSGRSPRRWPAQALRGLRQAVTGHPLLAVVTVIGALMLGLVTSTAALVGNYNVVVSSGLVPPGFAASLVNHLTLAAFGVGVLPLMLTVAFVVEALWAPADRRAHALAVCLLVAICATAFVATSFDVRFSDPISERYVFYVGPLFVVGALCFAALARRPLGPLVVGVALGAVVVLTSSGLVPANNSSSFYAPARQGLVPLYGHLYRIGRALHVGSIDPIPVLAVAAAAAALAVAFLLRAGRRTLVLGALGVGLTLWCGLLTTYIGPKVLFEHESLAENGLSGNLPLGQRSWIDAKVGRSADVGIAPTTLASRDGRPIRKGTVTDPSVWWEAEFWNRSVRGSFVLAGSRDWTPYSQHAMTVRPRTGALHVTGGLAPYLALANANVLYGMVGTQVAQTRDLRLIRPARPYRLLWRTDGITALGDIPPEGDGVVQVYGKGDGRARRASVSLALAGQTLSRPLTVRTAGAATSLRVFGRARVRRTLCVPPGRPGDVRLHAGARNALRLVSVTVRMGGPCRPLRGHDGA